MESEKPAGGINGVRAPETPAPSDDDIKPAPSPQYSANRYSKGNRKQTLPFEFSYEETALTQKGRPARRRVRLRLWDFVAACDQSVILGLGV